MYPFNTLQECYRILKMCMKKLNDNFFLDKFTAFSLGNICTIAYKMSVNSVHFVKSYPLRAFSVTFQYFVSMIHTY